MRLLVGICAAGRSARMEGLDKLTEPLPDGSTLLGRAVDAARHFDTLVALPPVDTPFYNARAKTIGETPYAIVLDAAQGHSQSVKALARAAGEYDGLIVLLADMPLVTDHHVASVAQVFQDLGGSHIVRAVDSDGRQGHPVAFPSAILPKLAELEGDAGARELIEAHGIKPVQFDGTAPTYDVNTRAEFDALVTWLR